MITVTVHFADRFEVCKLDAQTKRFANINAAVDWIFRNRDIIRRINDEPLGNFSYSKTELKTLLDDVELFRTIRWSKYEAAGEE